MGSLVRAVFSTAKEVSIESAHAELAEVLAEGEEVTGAFKVVRDMFVFTQCRLLLVDRQGLTGKKTEYLSIPYRSITKFSVETAGTFDYDSELKVWVSGDPAPLKKEFKKGTDVVGIQKMLGYYIFSASA